MGTFARHVALFACTCMVGFAPDIAAAQGCAPGLVASETSAGRCCWPGQTWSDADARCDGIPACPEGFGGDGNTCVASSAPRARPSAATAWALGSPERPESPFDVATPPVPTVSTVRRVNNNIVFGGLALALSTYAGSLAEGFIWSGELTYFLPLGALVGAFQSASYSWVSTAAALAFGLGQVVGIVLMVAGATCFRRRGAVTWANDGLAIAF